MKKSITIIAICSIVITVLVAIFVINTYNEKKQAEIEKAQQQEKMEKFIGKPIQQSEPKKR